MKQFNYKSNKGFSMLAIILVIMAVIVAISAWSLSGNMNINNNINNGFDLQANNIINDSNAIKVSYDNIKSSGADLATIVFIPNTDSTATNPNILDPATGIVVPKVDPKILRSDAVTPEGMWVYNKAFSADNISVGLKVPAILVTGIKNDVCKRINYAITGTETIPTKPANTKSNVYVVGATVAKPMGVLSIPLFGSVVYANNFKRGCVSASNTVPDQNVYFLYL